MSLADRRSDYEWGTLDRQDLAADPIAQWWAWYEEVTAAGVEEPHAMSVATIGDDGLPDARVVLARGVDERGFVFYTNLESAKAQQVASRPVAAATFAWLSFHRQVRLRGVVEPVSAEEADRYFRSRPKASRIGAWASPQSRVLADRAELDALVAAADAQFPGDDIPRPPHWGGLRIVPSTVEFWQGRPSRLHDRFRYRREAGGNAWIIERLAP
ncbi:MAG TPA: pyridoxamine 5'-phosphate oxidase [Acidimicrobiales bacterium]|nr:pyridoxamine 5'-phosphate oxidase [Acidimicrobiales bacterium]